MFSVRIVVYVIFACLAGCSAISSPFNNNTSSSSNNSQLSQPDDFQTTDDTPYAIGQYLDEIKVAGRGQAEEQPSQSKGKRQN
jgi:hypothetical protein